MKNLWKKGVSLALAAAMAGSLMSVSAFAADPADENAVTGSAAAEAEETADAAGSVQSDAAEEEAAVMQMSDNLTEAETDSRGVKASAMASKGISTADTEGTSEEELMMRAYADQTISVNETVEVTIDTASGYDCLYFTPEEDGYYEFSSASEEGYDTYGYLLDAEMNILAADDDSGEDLNFSIIWDCMAGTTYILRAEFLNPDMTGSFSVTVSDYDPTDAYSSTNMNYYAFEGDSITLEAMAYDFYGNTADLSGEEFTFAWHKVLDYYDSTSDSWVYEESETLGTDLTYTIEALDSSDLYIGAADIYNQYVCYIYKSGKQVAFFGAQIANADYFLWNYGKNIYASEGDSVTLELDAVYDYNDNPVDLSGSEFTFEWYKVLDYQDDEAEGWVYEESETLGTDLTYTIDALEENDFYQPASSEYSHYVCSIYKNGIPVLKASVNIYNNAYYYESWSYVYNAYEGDSLTLNPGTLYDSDGNIADLSGEEFTFAWHKVLDYYDSTSNSWVYEKSETLGTESTYTIDALEESDFYQSSSSVYNHYECYVFKNGVRVAIATADIWNKDYCYNFDSRYFYASEGDSLTLEMGSIYDYDGNLADVSGSEFTFEWYRVLDYEDSETGEWVYETGDVLGTGQTFTIAGIGGSDFYDSVNSVWNHYECAVYKNGIRVGTCWCYIRNKDSYYTASGSYEYLRPGDSVSLSFSLYDYDGNRVDPDNGDFTFEWYKVTESSTKYEISDVLGTDSAYTIDVLEESDFYFPNGSIYNRYVCYIYKNGSLLETVNCYLYNKDNCVYTYSPDYYVNVGDSLTMELDLFDYDGNDLDLDEFTFEWHKVTDTASTYHIGSTLGTGSSYTIDAVEESDFYQYSSSIYNHYICYVYRDGMRMVTVYSYIYNKAEVYNGSSVSYYANVGDSVTLELQIRDYDGNPADVSGSEFTYEWTKITDYYDGESWIYEVSDILGTASSLTIDSLAEDDFYRSYESVYNYYECRVYKNGTYIAVTNCRIRYPDMTYFGYGVDYYQSSGSLTLEAQVLDYMGEPVDLSGDEFTFQWIKETSYGDDTDWYWGWSDVLGTGQTYTIEELERTDLYSPEDSMYNRYYCEIYKNGVYVAETCCMIRIPDPDMLLLRSGNTFSVSYTLDGTTDLEFSYGKATDEVLVGDWDGDGIDTICLRRGSTFYISNTLGEDAEYSFTFGKTTDEALVGDWDGDGVDTLCLRRGNVFYITNSTTGSEISTSFTFGDTKDEILAGDWDGDGCDTLSIRSGNRYDICNSLGGEADASFTFGKSTDGVIVGDWDGDGVDTLCLRRGTTCYISNSPQDGSVDATFSYGESGDEEVYAGKWGSAPEEEIIPDTLALRRGNSFYVSYSLDGATDLTFTLGEASDEVLVGDWDGDGYDTICLRSGNRYYFSNTLGGEIEFSIKFGKATDEVFAGDWDGDGCDTLCIRRGNQYFINNTLEGGNAATDFYFGRESDEVLAGDWDGDGCDTLCIRRGSMYYMNNTLEGGYAAAEFAFGKSTDDVIVGDWDGDGCDTLCIRRGNQYFINNTLEGGYAGISFTFGKESDEALAGKWQQS